MVDNCKFDIMLPYYNIGEFGIVYKASLLDNGMEEDVAVKTLKGTPIYILLHSLTYATICHLCQKLF